MMSFATNTSSRKPRRTKLRKSKSRHAKRAYLFESLEERLNLSVMVLDGDLENVPNNDTTDPIDFAGHVAAAQEIGHPGLTPGVVDTVVTGTVIENNRDFYRFSATVDGEISFALHNLAGDPSNDGELIGEHRLEAHVYSGVPTAEGGATVGGQHIAVNNLINAGDIFQGTFPASKGDVFFITVDPDVLD